MMTLNLIVYWIGILFFSFLVLLVAYALLCLLGALIPSHKLFKPSDEGFDFYLHTNGLHTSFILPVQNKVFDWTATIKPHLFEVSSASSFLGFGWGDRAIYLDIVEWSELSFQLGFRTLFLPTPGLMHVEAHHELPTANILHTRVSKEQYQQLCQFILQTFSLDQQEKVQLIPGVGYTPNDQFYLAEGKYHAFNTCNTWAARGLRKIGVRTALWASIDRSIFYQFKKIQNTSQEVIFENQHS